MATLAVNAVLIQTVVTDPDSPVKTLVRAGVIVVSVLTSFVAGTVFPKWIVASILYSLTLLLLRNNPDQLSYVFVLAVVPLMWSLAERRVLRLMTFASIASLTLIFGFLLFGITHNVTLELRNRATYGTQGVPFFYNVVYGAASLFVLYVWKYFPHRRFLALAVTLSGTSYLFSQTDARGGYFSFVAFVSLLFVVPGAARSRVFRGAVCILPVACLATSFVIASLWQKPEYDELLSSRPTLLHTFLDNVSWEDVVWSSTVKNVSQSVSSVRTVDNSYLHLLVGGGAFFTGVFFFVFGSAVLELFRRRAYADIAFLIASVLYFNSESIMLRVENVFVVYVWYLVITNCRWTTRAIPYRHFPNETSSATETSDIARTHEGDRWSGDAS